MNENADGGALAGTTADFGQTAGQIVYRAARTATIEGWWTWAGLVIAAAVAIGLTIWLYRRDAASLPRPVRVALIWLRLVAIGGLIFFFLDVSRLSQSELTRPSEVAVLVDTSQSMSLPIETTPGSISRIDRTANLLSVENLPASLSEDHRVTLYRTTAIGAAEAIGTFVGDELSPNDDPAIDPVDRPEDTPPRRQIVAPSTGPSIGPLSGLLGGLLVLIGGLLSIGSLTIGAARRGSDPPGTTGSRWQQPGSWILAAAIVLTVGLTVTGAAYAIHTDTDLVALMTGGDSSTIDPDDSAEPAAQSESDRPVQRDGIDPEQITAVNAQSRIGDAVRGVLSQHDPSTLAGVVVVTDGQNNGGIEIRSAAAAARRSEVMVVPIGMGSSDLPVNVRVVDLDVPRRVYPGDRFAVSAVLQASGSSPMTVDVQLLDELDRDHSGSGANNGQPSLPDEIIETKRVTLSPDSKLQTVPFEVMPDQVGRRRLAVRVVAPPADQNDRDDAAVAKYEVIAKRLRVLAVAGGPTREYRFVRNLLYRDESVQLDVFLQTGTAGISQDADNLLEQIPSTPETLLQYDAVVMFDPDWTTIDLATVNLLERYVAQQAGGLVLIAGPVFHPQWIRRRTDPRTATISGFFPVTFSTGSPIATAGRAGGDAAWPLKLTDAAARADFFDIADDPDASQTAWRDFDGVYDYVSVKGVKPAATVYAYFSDPTTEIGGSLPVFLASQFYGAGRVLFCASGEMWRLRGEEESYFDAFYTKLVRWVAQGRLQRDGKRGVLLVDNDRAMVGDTITLRAILVDEKFSPLTDPQITATVLLPGDGNGNGGTRQMTLRPVPGDARPGTYTGRYVVDRGGDHEFRITLGSALSEEVLTRNVAVRLPTIELERPQRNDEDLTALASMTDGFYIPVGAETDNASILEKLVGGISPQPQVSILPGTPDDDFARRRNAALLWLIATALTMEWIVRRLHRLA